MRVDIIGGGPAGLFLSILLRRDRPEDDVRVYERNEPDASAGWAVVFPEGSLTALSRAEPGVYEAIDRIGVNWTQVEIRCRGSRYLVEGNRFHGIGRDALLGILRERAAALGVEVRYGHRVTDPGAHAEADLVVGADGPHSVVRAAFEGEFRPRVELGSFWYGWFGVEAARPTFGYLFVDTEWGLFQGYVYPSGESWSSFIVYVSEETRRRSGLDRMEVEESLRFCERVFAAHLDGRPLMRRGPAWTRFRHLRCERWHTGNTVLIGDAAHTAHWSIGSGTRLAIEDAIALAERLRANPASVPDALPAYEKARRDRVERFQEAARLSERYFDNVGRYLDFEPIQFAYQLVARSWRITYGDIARRDPDFIRRFDAWFHSRATGTPTEVAPPPVFAPIEVGGLRLANRIVSATPTEGAGLVIGGPPAPGTATAAPVRSGRLAPDLASARESGYLLALLDLGSRRLTDLLVPPPPDDRTADPTAGAVPGLGAELAPDVASEVSALRAGWPDGLPVGVSLGLAPGCDSAAGIAEAVALARLLKRSNVDLVLLQAVGEPPPGAVTQVADAVRNESGLVVAVDDRLGTLAEADTAIAAGRADLCVLRFGSGEGKAR
ncbi:FAD-dependent monooxygenase [Nonomuraea longicatena]|uniref:FAD-binding domain-containing protein n=1 Tax=Nonomuraea longicatena TaxID=83682 RepID=A0ABP4BGF9_9ACTN